MASISIKNAIITVTPVSATHARKMNKVLNRIQHSYRPDAQKKRGDVHDKTAYKTINKRTETGVREWRESRKGVGRREVMLVV